MLLPTLDYEKSLSDKNYGSDAVFGAFKEPGFLFINNIPGFNAEKLYEWTKWFFEELSVEDRKKLEDKHSYHGYVEAKEDAESSYKHLIEFGPFHDEGKTDEYVLQDANKWPENADFKKFMVEYYDLMVAMATHLVTLVSKAVGANTQDWLSKFLPNNMSTLRLIKYPERKGPVPESLKVDDIELTCGSHQDTGAVTLLAIFDQPGLQILHEGEYKDIESKEPGLVVNVGLLLVNLCGHGIKATEHRVVDIGRTRYSVPFFFEPRWQADVVVELDGKVGMWNYGKYSIQRLKVFFEHKDLADYLEEKGLA